MTVQVRAGPGTETYRSGKYSATVNGVATYVSKRAQKSAGAVGKDGATFWWATDDIVTVHFTVIGSDVASVALVVTLLSGPVTSVTVYCPVAVTNSIVAGTLHLTMPYGEQAIVVINGDHKELLILFSDPLKPVPSVGYEEFDGSQTEALSAETLYFPPGVWTIGQLFPVNSDATLIFDPDAWLIGSFDVRGTDRVLMDGAAALSGEWVADWYTTIAAGGLTFEQLSLYAGILGYDHGIGANNDHSGSTLRGLIILDPNFWCTFAGFNTIDRLKNLAFWHYWVDGFNGDGDQNNNGIYSVTNSFSFVGDDNLKAEWNTGIRTIANHNFLANTNGSNILFGYWGAPAGTYQAVVTDSYCLFLNVSYGDPLVVGSSITVLTDGEIGQETYGRFNWVVNGHRIAGPIDGRIAWVSNETTAWNPPNDNIGQAAYGQIHNLVTERTPVHKSTINGEDAVNTPHDIVISDWDIGGTPVTADNYLTFFDVNEFVYNLTILPESAMIPTTISPVPTPFVPGTEEKAINPKSGLFNRCFTQIVTSDGDCIIDGGTIGGASSAAVTTWTAIALTSNAPTCNATLVAKVIQTSATTGTFQLRVSGYDQFGRHVIETTPSVAIAAKTNNFIYLAHIFSWVYKVEFLSTGLDSAGDTLDLGNLFDWTQTVDASNAQSGGDNLGLALPFVPNVEQGTMANRVLVTAPPAVAATATLTISGNPTAGQTIVIDGHTYTWRATVSTTADEVKLGADAAAHALNLAYAIKADPAQTSLFGSLTVKHTTVEVRDLPTTGVLRIWSVAKKSTANRLATTETSSNAVWDNGTTMINGHSANGEVRSISTRNVTDNAGTAATCVILDNRKFEIGLLASGWTIGSVAKWRPVKAADVAAWASTDAVVCTVDMHPQSLRT